MIRLGGQTRLTRRELERFVAITDVAPKTIRTLEDLGGYVERCKRHY